MTRNEKIIAGILIGASAGIAAAIFFETEKGKKLLEDIKDMVSETFDDALNRFANLEEKLKEKITLNDTGEEATLS